MGRVKLQLQKIENRTYRHISFSKRKSGIVKKAYELSTLCDVELALIIFSPTGKLILYEGKKRVEEILARYIELPAYKRGRRLENQEALSRIVLNMRLEISFHQLAFASNIADGTGESSNVVPTLEDIQKQIFKCSAELENAEKELQYFIRSPYFTHSLTDLEHQQNILHESLRRVRIHKQYLESSRSLQHEYPNVPDHSSIRCREVKERPYPHIPKFLPPNVLQLMRTNQLWTSIEQTTSEMNNFYRYHNYLSVGVEGNIHDTIIDAYSYCSALEFETVSNQLLHNQNWPPHQGAGVDANKKEEQPSLSIA